MIRMRLVQEGPSGGRRLRPGWGISPEHFRVASLHCNDCRIPEAEWPLASQPHGCVYEFAPAPTAARLRAPTRVTAVSLSSHPDNRVALGEGAAPRVTSARPFADPDIQWPTRRCRSFHDRRPFVETSAEEGPPGHFASVKLLILERAGGIVDHQSGTCTSGSALVPVPE
jgi:hypothetical protein